MKKPITIGVIAVIAVFSIGIDYAFADFESAEPVITVQMTGPSTFYLDSPTNIIRASVEIQNYTPSDGRYYMGIIHLPTQKILKVSEIYPKASKNDLHSVAIAYPILESNIKFIGQEFFGEFEILIKTEFGLQTASTKFSIFESRKSELDAVTDSQSQIYPPSLELDAGPSDETIQKIPDWIKNTMQWYLDGLISEDEMISAIQFLVNEGIIKLD